MKTNFKYIEEGYSKDQILDALNINFDQILFSSVGYKGDYGPKGPKGLRGQIGKIGPVGATGDRASRWFRQNEEPSTDVRDYDYWVNTSPGASGSDSIYVYGSGSWTYTGETFLKGSTLFKYSGILGPSGITSKNAIIDSDYTNPYSSTFVFSDAQLSSNNANLNYSKLKIINSINQGLPLLSFCKLDYNDPLHPSFYWRSTNPSDLGISHRGSGKYRIDSNGEIGMYAGLADHPSSEGNFSINSSSINSNSTGTVELSSGGTGSDGSAMSISAQAINISSLNMNASSDMLSFDRGLSIGATGQTGPRLKVTSPLPNSTNIAVVEFNSYISSPGNITFEGALTVDDFILDGIQSPGEGPFRTDLVGITGGISGNVYLPYVKFGFPGVSGSYPTTGVHQVSQQYYGNPSIINLASVSHYSKQGISITTTNTSPPIGGKTYVKISQSLSTISNPEYPTTYRFYYRGNLTGGVLTRGKKFSGINYTRSNGFTSTNIFLDFNQDVETFEITYDTINNLFYYRAMGSCGIGKFSEDLEEIGGEIPFGGFF